MDRQDKLSPRERGAFGAAAVTFRGSGNEEAHVEQAPEDGPPTAGDPTARPATPTWVKVFGLVLLAVLVVAGVMLLMGGGHGPGRH